MLQRVRSWFSCSIRLLADGAYFNRSLVVPLADLEIEVVSRIRADARLRLPVPPRRRSGPGRPPKWGAWLPQLRPLARSDACFSRCSVQIYGRRVALLLREVVGYGPPLGRVIKVVLAKDPKHKRRVTYLASTDLSLDGVAVVEPFALP